MVRYGLIDVINFDFRVIIGQKIGQKCQHVFFKEITSLNSQFFEFLKLKNRIKSFQSQKVKTFIIRFNQIIMELFNFIIFSRFIKSFKKFIQKPKSFFNFFFFDIFFGNFNLFSLFRDNLSLRNQTKVNNQILIKRRPNTSSTGPQILQTFILNPFLITSIQNFHRHFLQKINQSS